MKFIIIFLIFSDICRAEMYQFVSINYLIEQEIGRIVLPKIYDNLGIDIKIVPLPGKRAQFEATTGISDGEIMRIFSYGEENPTTHRVPTPYYYLETMAFIKKDSGVKIRDRQDLSKYRIAKVRGVKHTNNITKGLTQVSDFNTTKQIMMFVALGRADVALTNKIDGLMVLKQFGIDNIVPAGKPLATLDLFNYIHQDHKAIIPRVDSMIKKMKESGELARIIKNAEKGIILKKITDIQLNSN